MQQTTVEMNSKYVLTLLLSTLMVTLMLIRIQSEQQRVILRNYKTTIDDESKKDEDVISSNFESTIALYLKGRDEGMSPQEITKHIFNISLPNYDPKRLHSYPFLSGDTLRSFADWVYEQKTHNREMRDGDVIFVKADYAESFATDIFPKLEKKFILITHNSDHSRPTEPKSLEMLEHPKLIRWFCQNAAIQHPKLIPIPIGLENRHFNSSGDIEKLDSFLRDSRPFFDSNHPRDSERPHLVYVNFSPKTNRKFRLRAQQVFAKIGTTTAEKISQLEYWTEIRRSKFVLSPPGNGIDCHRTWESVVLGAIPIVDDSVGMRPIWEISPVFVKSDWDEPAKEETFLNFQLSVRNRNVILAQYWFDLIDSFRNQ